MISLIKNAYQCYLDKEDIAGNVHSLASLAARIYIAQVFFLAGLTKIRDWDTTLFLFEEEYQVPILSPQLAAIMGTAGELVLPVLFVFGFLTRFSAVGLFFVNLVAVISLVDIPAAALYLHYVWGILIAQVAIYGGGIASIDSLVKKFTNK